MNNNCDHLFRQLPCNRFCTLCGDLINPEIPENKHCSFKHLGYWSVARHNFCPDCGEQLNMNIQQIQEVING